MTEEQTQAMLTMLEYNLEIITDYMDAESKTAKETELTQYLSASIDFIEREGITLDLGAVSDEMLVVMYSAWLYDKRRDPNAPMPRMIRYNLNNRLMAEKVNV